MKYEIRLSLLSSLLCALLVLQSCNSGVFIRPLEIDTHEIVLDGAGTHVRVPVSTDDWNIKGVFSLGSEPQPEYVSPGLYSIDTAVRSYSVSRDGADLVVSLNRYLGAEPTRISIVVANEYGSASLEATLMPTGSVEVTGIDYSLDSWSGYKPFSFTETILEVHYPHGLGSPSYEFAPLSGVVSVYRFVPHGSGDEMAKLVLSSGAVVPLPSSGPTIGWDWQLRGEEGALSTSWTPLVFSNFPAMPGAFDVPAGEPVALKLQCDFECCVFSCRVHTLNTSTGEESAVDALLYIEMPVKLYCTHEPL